MNDMAQLLGANKFQSFVANPLRIYDYAYDTKVDLFLFYLHQTLLSHSKLVLNEIIFKR
jgi:hypothetical protein